MAKLKKIITMKEKCLKQLLIIMLIVALILFGAMAWLMLSHQPKPVKKIERENIDSLFDYIPDDTVTAVTKEHLVGKWTLAYTEIKYGGMVNEVVHTDIEDSEYNEFVLTIKDDDTRMQGNVIIIYSHMIFTKC